MEKKKKKLKNSLAVMGLALSMSIGSSHNTRAESIISNYSLEENNTDSFDLDNMEDYIIQGVTTINNRIFITAYNPNGKNSKVFIYDSNKKFVKTVMLYNNAHVGGITYDPKSKNVWITDIKGTISGYKYMDFINRDHVEPIYKQVDVSNKLINIWGQRACAYITIYNNRIYVGNFNTNKNSYLKSYSINKDGSINLSECTTQKFMDSVQGISFFERDNNTYLCISSSFGRSIKSQIKILKYSENIENLNEQNSICINCPPMIEQININNDGSLISVYESNAIKYRTKTKTSTDFMKTDINEVLDENIKSL